MDDDLWRKVVALIADLGRIHGLVLPSHARNFNLQRVYVTTPSEAVCKVFWRVGRALRPLRHLRQAHAHQLFRVPLGLKRGSGTIRFSNLRRNHQNNATDQTPVVAKILLG